MNHHQSLDSNGLKTLMDEQTKEFRDVLNTPGDIGEFCDKEVDTIPFDNCNDRDHFPDCISDKEIDEILEKFNTDFTRKTGRFEVPDPDDDGDNYDSGDPSNDPDSDLY